MAFDYLITTDSGCDLQLPVCKKRGIIPLFMKYTVDSTVCTDGMTEEECREFFAAMRKGDAPSTSQINIIEYTTFWRPLLSEGKPIIHISLGGGISGSYNNALQAVEMLRDEFPSLDIRVINSTQASAGYGLMCMKAAELRDAGKTVDECVQWLEENKQRVNAWYTTADLTYLQRGGRVSRTGAFVAGVLNINPIMNLDAEGHLQVSQKVRGRQATLDRIADIVKNTVENPQEQTLYVSHADAYDEAKKFGERLRREIGFKDCYYTFIGPTIGAHTGPGLIAVFYEGKKR